MAEAPRVLAVVLNWRQPDITVECVSALRRMDYAALDIVVIDNGSGDDSVARLRAALPDARLLELPDNLGFAGGVNAGLRLARAEGYDHALLVNNDAFAAPDMLARLMAETAPDIALLTPKILYETPAGVIWFAGGRRQPGTLDLVDSGRGEPDGPAFAASRDVDYVLGAGTLVNLTAVAAVGLLDERYFMYFEDLDWSLRFQTAGYRLRYVADARLTHRVAVSSGGLETPLRRYHLARSGVIFWRRHARAGRPGLIIAFRLGSAVKMVVRLLATGQGAAARAYWRGLRDGWQAGGDHAA